MKKKIGIFTRKIDGVSPWDPDSVHRGILGSEEAVVYASQELAKLGHQVYVFNDTPYGSKYGLPDANPRYLNYCPDHLHFDVIIICRVPEFVEFLKDRGDAIYFWPHDPPSHRVKEEVIREFDNVLWLSSWQRKLWIAMTPSFAQFADVFGNGLQPYQFKKVKERENPYSCIYGSNYVMGLSFLLDIWPIVKKAYSRATLDIYYGWQHWGTMSEVQERKLRSQLIDCQTLDVKEHGLVGHEEIADAYGRASFWTYPCLYPEMFCITAIKAQLSGAIPVIIDGSALKEVVHYGFKCYRKEEYLSSLLQAMAKAEEITVKEREEMGEFILNEFTWERVVSKWDDLFCSI